MNFLRILLVPLVIFISAFLIGWADIRQGTVDTGWLKPTAAAASAALPSDLTGAPLDNADAGGALDAPDAGASTGTGTGPADTDKKLQRDEVFTHSMQWMGALVGIAAMLAAGWAYNAERLRFSLGGPTGYGRARRSWWLLLLLYLLFALPAAWAAFSVLELGDLLYFERFVEQSALFALLGLAVFWLATALAAEPVMRPAVPLAGRLPTGRGA